MSGLFQYGGRQRHKCECDKDFLRIECPFDMQSLKQEIQVVYDCVHTNI